MISQEIYNYCTQIRVHSFVITNITVHNNIIIDAITAISFFHTSLIIIIYLSSCKGVGAVKTMDKELNGCVGDEYDIVCVHAYIALASDPGSVLSGGGNSLVPRFSARY